MSISSFSDLVSDINLSDFETLSTGLPKGDYKCLIEKSELKTDGKYGPEWHMTFKVLEGEHKDATQMDFIGLPQGNPSMWSRETQISEQGREFTEYESNVFKARKVATRMSELGIPPQERNKQELKNFEGMLVMVRIYIDKKTDRSKVGQVAVVNQPVPQSIQQSVQQPQQVSQPYVAPMQVQTPVPQQVAPPSNTAPTGIPSPLTPTTPAGNPFAAQQPAPGTNPFLQ